MKSAHPSFHMYNFPQIFPTFQPHCTAWCYLHALSIYSTAFFVSSLHVIAASLHIDSLSKMCFSPSLPLQHPCSFLKANPNTYVAFHEYCRQKKGSHVWNIRMLLGFFYILNSSPVLKLSEGIPKHANIQKPLLKYILIICMIS